MRKALVLLLLLVGCGGGSTGLVVTAGAPMSLALSWTVPTRNVDGSTLIDIASYQIKYGTSPSALASTVTVPSTQTSLLIQNLSPGVYYATVSTVNSKGETSDPAGPVSGTVR